MINKKTLAVTALTLLLSQQPFASKTEGFYFGSGYYGQYLNGMGELKAKIGDKDAADTNRVSINDRNAQSTEGQLLSKYKEDYNPPFAANVAFGYKGELNGTSYKAELEGMYSSVNVDNIGLTSSQITVSYLKDFGQNANKRTYLYSVAVSHDEIESISVMANVYHHWKSDRFSFSPYVGIGIGATRMTIFEKSSIIPAGQLKAGFDYRINEDVNLHFGWRGFGVRNHSVKLQAEELGQVSLKDKVFTLDREEKSKLLKKGEKITEDMSIGNQLFHTHGIESGLTFHFASKV